MLAKRGAGQQGDHDALTSPSSPLASESRLSEDLLMQPRTCWRRHGARAGHHLGEVGWRAGGRRCPALLFPLRLRWPENHWELHGAGRPCSSWCPTTVTLHISGDQCNWPLLVWNRMSRDLEVRRDQHTQTIPALILKVVIARWLRTPYVVLSSVSPDVECKAEAALSLSGRTEYDWDQRFIFVGFCVKDPQQLDTHTFNLCLVQRWLFLTWRTVGCSLCWGGHWRR